MLRPLFASAFLITTLSTASVNAGVISFQQNVGAYTGVQDTYTDGSALNSNFDTSGSVIANGNPSDALIRFNNIFGAGASQVPLGATIDSATLTLEVFDAGVADVRRMMTDWDSTSITYLNAMLNGNTTAGIQADGLEASLTPTLDDVSISGTVVLDVTSDLQAWSSGTENFGWAILNAGNDTRFSSSETATASSRPLLTVTFETAAVPEPSTFALLALLAPGLMLRRRRAEQSLSGI